MPVILKNKTILSKLIQISLNKAKIFNFYSTIYSLSSGLNSSLKSKSGVAIAVIRVSGPETGTILEKFTRGQSKIFYSNPRKANLINLYDIKNKELIDKCIGIWFPEPASYTGEDMCEFYLHGSQAIVSSVLKNLSYFQNTNPAENGEFTKRSFLNKKISLIQAEAINDLIESTNDSQRKNALEGLDGKIIKMYENWRKKLIQLHAYIEATIEFGEDQLLDEEKIDKTVKKLFSLNEEIEKFLVSSSKKRKILKNGLSLCILGKPNVGKSSLMNKICDQDLSIVSPFEGTTRDIIQYPLNISGFNVFLNDTAGLRNLEKSNENYIENKGIELALTRAKAADIILYVIDASQYTKISDSLIHSFANIEKSFKDLEKTYSDKKIIYVFNKIDLLSYETKKNFFHHFDKKDNSIFLSCSTNENLEKLIDMIIKKIKLIDFDQNLDHVSFITERHENHLNHVKDNINEAMSIYKEDYCIASFYIKNAINEIGLITGLISTEQILDVIFKDFCIGK